MAIYINTNNISMEVAADGVDLIQHLKENDMKYYTQGEKRLPEVEQECLVYILNLKMFNDSIVNLRSGAEIGLSKWFKMIIFTIISPANENLKNELIGIGAFVFLEDEVVLIQKILGDPTISRWINHTQDTMNVVTHVEERNELRELFYNNIGNQMISLFITNIINRRERIDKLEDGYAKL